jgi:RNA polymerase sigma-70 factor (ECF subfamily)
MPVDLVRRTSPAERTAPVAVEDHGLRATTPAQRSFVTLYELLFARLCDFAARFLDWDAAQDAVQEAMCDILLRWPDVATERPSVSFFFRAVRNQIAVMRRRGYREALRLGRFLREVLRWSRSTRLPDVALEHAELAGLIDDTVAAMPERCREVWLLVREYELTYEQASQVLDLSLKTVKQHMTRAQRLLRKVLIDAGYHEAALRKPKTSRALPKASAVKNARGTARG